MNPQQDFEDDDILAEQLQFNVNALAPRESDNLLRGYFLIDRDEDRIWAMNLADINLDQQLLPFLSTKTPYEIIDEWEFGGTTQESVVPLLISMPTITVDFYVGGNLKLNLVVHILDITKLYKKNTFAEALCDKGRGLILATYANYFTLGWTSVELSWDYYGVSMYDWMKEIMYWTYQYITIDESDPKPSKSVANFTMDEQSFGYGRFTTCTTTYAARACPVRCRRTYNATGIKRVRITDTFNRAMDDPDKQDLLESVLNLIMEGAGSETLPGSLLVQAGMASTKRKFDLTFN